MFKFNRIYQVLSKISILVSFLLFAGSISAQNPDLALTDAERDSTLKNYDQIFPIWGKQAAEKGFDLPHPVGVTINGLYMNQNILISNLGLSSGENPTQSVDFIKFKDNTSKISTLNARFDLWVFPFLNIYSYVGQGWTNTEVEISEPIEFVSSVDQPGQYFGLGITGAMGIKNNWLSVDANWSWAFLEKLKDPVRARIIGIRYGRTFKLGGKKRLAVWIGTMNQKFESITEGQIAISEALPPETLDKLEDYQNSDWYQNLDQGQKIIADQLMEEILNRYDTAKINYRIDKAPANPWNLLIGANLEINKNWQVRAEAGLINRYSILAAVNYRFKL